MTLPGCWVRGSGGGYCGVNGNDARFGIRGLGASPRSTN